MRNAVNSLWALIFAFQSSDTARCDAARFASAALRPLIARCKTWRSVLRLSSLQNRFGAAAGQLVAVSWRYPMTRMRATSGWRSAKSRSDASS